MNRFRLALLLCLLLSPFSLHAQGASAPPLGAEEFVVRAGDLLRVRVWPDERLSGEFLVELSGHVYLPEVGEFKAAGLPLSALQQQLRKLYAETMKQPVVSITPLFPVGLLGGVAAPGMYQIEPTTTLMDVIIRAGGFSARAKQDQIRVLRAGQLLRFDARRALATGQSDLLVLQSGDRIVVPERRGFSWQTMLAVLQLAGTVVVLYNQITR